MAETKQTPWKDGTFALSTEQDFALLAKCIPNCQILWAGQLFYL